MRLSATPANASQYCNVFATMAMPTTGYWYAEFTGTGSSSGNNNTIGIVDITGINTLQNAKIVVGSERHLVGHRKS